MTAAARLDALAASPVWDGYWRFAAERQSVYLKRVRGEPGPWTADPIIGAHRFTNCYRAADRVSQYLLRHVIHRADLPATPEEVFYRTLLFKLFNRIDVWERLEAEAGPLLWTRHDAARLDAVLEGMLTRGERVYSAAYIMPSGTSSFGHARKHRNHLALIAKAMREGLPGRIAEAPDMAAVFVLLRAQPTIGDFLAYQLAIDLNYGPLTDFDESSFVVPGPGSRDGLRKCFGAAAEDGAALIRLTCEAQDEAFRSRGIAFPGLFGRRLQAIDCQNLFCEIDKYARVAWPEVPGRSGRDRIKQSFRQAGTLPAPWFPPKWGLNGAVEAFLAGAPDRAAAGPTR